MRVVCPFTTFHPLCERALDLYAPDAERWHLNEHANAYHKLLANVWADGEAFLIVEHDIEIRAGVVEELEACPEPYCLFPYVGPGGNDLLTRSMGCTRFSAELIAAHPTVFSDLADRDGETSPRFWKRIDAEVAYYFQLRNVAPHVHEPPVLHHHVYAKTYPLCACGEVHHGITDPRGEPNYQ